MEDYPKILHHGAVNGVTGSCHELRLSKQSAVLIDCGLFQGSETAPSGVGQNLTEIEFPVDHVKALIVTHVHLDHVGRIPYLLAAGFRGPIYCTEPSAILLPLVLEDAIKIGFTSNHQLIRKFIAHIKHQIIALPYRQWQKIDTDDTTELAINFKPAGHILGSAYVQCRCQTVHGKTRVIFSGDLGAPYAPLLPAPRSPYGADSVVLESTYGDRIHNDRRHRRQHLQAVLEHSLINRGVVLIPAFSIGRTQELLYELEELIHHNKRKQVAQNLAWEDLEIIVDSPLASRFTQVYRQLKPFWDREALRKVARNRHPLSFEQLLTIDSHLDHLRTVKYLAKTARPCVVVAASGMCTGGRVISYLKALIEDSRNDLLFVGYQAHGTPGRIIQTYGPGHGYVELEGERYSINASVHTLQGYSAHADKEGLLKFISRMRHLPAQVRLVHGDKPAKQALHDALMALAEKRGCTMEVVIP